MVKRQGLLDHGIHTEALQYTGPACIPQPLRQGRTGENLVQRGRQCRNITRLNRQRAQTLWRQGIDPVVQPGVDYRLATNHRLGLHDAKGLRRGNGGQAVHVTGMKVGGQIRLGNLPGEVRLGPM